MRGERGRRFVIATMVAAVSAWVSTLPARGQVIIKVGQGVTVRSSTQLPPPTEDPNAPPQPDCPSVRYGEVRLFHGSDVRSLAFTPDGKQLLAAGLRGGDVSVWNVESGQMVRSIKGMPSTIMAMSLSGHGKMLAVAASTRQVRLVSMFDGKELMHVRTQSLRATWVKISPDGKLLACSDGRSFFVVDLATGKQVISLADGTYGAFSPDGKTVAITSIRNLSFGIQIWNLSTGGKVRDLPLPGKVRVYEPAFSADGRYVAAGCLPSTNAAIVWDVKTGKVVRKFQGNSRYVPHLAFVGDANEVVTSDASNSLKVWNVKTGKIDRTLETGEARINALAVSADGGLIAAAGMGGQIHIWRTDGFDELLSKVGHTGPVRGMAASRDGALVVTGGADGRLILWRGGSGKVLRQIRASQSPLNHVALSPDGSLVAACGNGDEVSTWSTATGAAVKSVHTGIGAVSWVAFRSGGRELTAVGVTGGTALVNVASGKVRTVAKGDTKPTFRMVVSCDGSVAARYERSMVAPWSLVTGKSLGTYSLGHASYIYGLAIGPAGRLLAGDAGRGRGLVLEEMDSGQVVRHIDLKRQSSTTSKIAFSPDGSVLAASERDGSVNVWSVRNGQKLGQIDGHRGQATAIRFASGGQALLSGGADGTAVRWDIRPLLALEGPTTRPTLTAELVGCWEQLGSDDANAADGAFHQLVSAGDDAVDVLAERLKPVEAPNADEIGKLIGDLGDRLYAVRQQASDALGKLAPLAEPALRQASESSDSEEVRLRARQILASMDDPRQRTGATLQMLRGALVLERIGTPKAEAVLKNLAGGSADASLTHRAAEALERLKES